MNHEQKFDKIIKKKVDEAEFPFDEQNWNKLSMQLDAERNLATKRGWGKFLYLGLLFLGITSASIALYKTQGPFGAKGNLTDPKSTNDNTSSSAQEHNETATKKSNSEINLFAENNSNNKSNSNLNTLNTNEVNNISLKVNSELDNAVVNSGANDKLETTSISNNKNLASTYNLKTARSNSTSKKSSALVNENTNDLNENASTSGLGGEMNSSSRNKSDLAGAVVLDHTVLNRIDTKLPYVYSVRNVKIAAVKLPSWYDDDYRRKGKKKLSFLNAEVGGAYLFGWDSKDGKDAKGLNWYAGVNYGKFINKKIGFSVGSQFYNVGNIKQSFYESSKSVYGLGSTSSNTIITTQALFYFSVPVKFYYAINSAHQVGASVNPSFLFSSKNVVENYRLTDDVRSNEITSKTSGIYEGVRLNNILVSAFYRAKLNKRTYLNTEFLYGVRDVFKNTNTNNYSQKPIGFRVGLQYTLFEK